MEKMEVDDVVDLSVPSVPTPAPASDANVLGISQATARDLRALTQNSGLTITPAPPPPPAPMSAPNNVAPTVQDNGVDAARPTRRVLRPRTEPRSYAESPDIVLLPSRVNGRPHNGNIDSDTDDEEDEDDDDEDAEMPPMYPIKELTPAELVERERSLRKLREELRNEETKLILLKKLKQSQQIMMKENLIVTPSTNNSSNSPANLLNNSSTNLMNLNNVANIMNNTSLSSNPLAALPNLPKGSLSVTPTNIPMPAHKNRSNASVLRGQPMPGNNRSSVNQSNLYPPMRSSLPGGATLTPGPPHRSSSLTNSGHTPRTGSNLTITPSVTITPTSAPPVGSKSRNNDRATPRDDGQTPAQKQAAAKLALRKQLEKTLLQIPPPKPPPPEMHFIPNPSNTEFVYLLGLEHVVDYLTKEKKGPLASQPFRCAQCKIDFTPVWKWEKQGKGGNPTFQDTPATGKDPKVICEQCVTTNVKKALKAEHTNRLKTAFVKALQQEQEIEQRLSVQSSPSPVDLHSSITASVVQQQQQQQQQSQQPSIQVPPSKSQTPTPRPAPTPPNQATPPPSSSSSRSSRHDSSSSSAQQQQQQAAAAAAAMASFDKFPAQLGALGNLANLSQLTNTPAGAAAIQALQQQLFRGLQGLATNNPQHMMQFTPFLFSYQYLMAAQAAAGKNPTNLSELQRMAEARQFLMDMIPPQGNQGSSNSSNRQNNWKT